MLIKSQDDKSKRLDLLESLRTSPVLDRDQQTWAREEWWRLRNGIQGETDAAHYIDSHFRDSENFAVLHDLRIVVDGDVAQIDHLLIGRSFCFLLETKCFGGNLHINEQGEFSVTYPSGKTYGVPSPIEQSRRHEKVLRKLMDRLEIKTRTGQPMAFEHVVMVHPKATITRPSAQAFDTRNVIKADQLPSRHAQFVESELSALKMLGMLLNVRSSDTVRQWAEKLARQHRPADLLALPDSMRPSPSVSRAPLPNPQMHAAPPPEATASRQIRHARASGPEAVSDEPLPSTAEKSGDAVARRLLCATCGDKISFKEGCFCWNSPGRFGGLQYCRKHQADFA